MRPALQIAPLNFRLRRPRPETGEARAVLTPRELTRRPRKWRRIPGDMVLSTIVILLAAGGYAAEYCLDRPAVSAPVATIAQASPVASQPQPIPAGVPQIDEKMLEMVAPALTQAGPASPNGLTIVVSRDAEADSVRDNHFPNDAEDAEALGTKLAKDGDTPASVDALRRAASLAPGNARYLFNLASALDHAGRGQEAAQYYGAALEAIGPGGAADGIPVAAIRARLEYLTR